MTKVTTITFGGDVAKAIAGLCGNYKAIREDYNLTSSEYFTWGDVVDIYFNVLKEYGISPKVEQNTQTLNLKIPSLKYQVMYARLFNRRFDNSKLMNAVPDLVFSDVKKELERCLLHNIKHADHKTILCITNILQDRKSHYILPRSEVGSFKRYMKYLAARFAPENIVIKYLS